MHIADTEVSLWQYLKLLEIILLHGVRINGSQNRVILVMIS